MDLEKVNKVYFIGIGGIGVSALARMFKALGKTVAGSDSIESEITQELQKQNIKINIGHKAENISSDFDLVVFSSAVPVSNVERVQAKIYGIKEISYNELLGKITQDKKTIAITGTHGKTTTTAMTGLMLHRTKLDPSIIVGAKVKQLNNSNFHLGKGDYLVTEACEYREHMLEIKPHLIILTNIDEDHLDYYKDIDHIISAFQKFIDKLKIDDILVYNKDDQNIEKLNIPDAQLISYGILNQADIMAHDIIVEEGKQVFKVSYKGTDLGEFSLQVPGTHNIYNALAAIACGLKLDVALEDIKTSLERYKGGWRRFDKLGKIRVKNGEALLITDYAHHPTELKATIRATKDFYPTKRLFTVFQPHQHNRTKNLFDYFTESFDNADHILISEVYDVTGREEKQDQDVSSEKLVQELKKRKNIISNDIEVNYAKNLDDIYNKILQQAKLDDVILIMGAGDIYDVAKKLIEKNESKRR